MTGKRKTVLNKSYIKSSYENSRNHTKGIKTTTELIVDNLIQPGTTCDKRTEDENIMLNPLRDLGSDASLFPGVLNLIDQLMRMAQQTLKASASSIILVDEGQKWLLFQFAEGPVGRLLKHATFNSETGIAGWVASNAKPLIVNDVTKDPRFCKDMDKITGFVTTNILCVPLIVEGKVIGVIEVLNKQGGEKFDNQDLESMTGVASILSIIIERKQAEGELRKREQYFRALIENSLDTIVILNRDRTIRYESPSAELVLGHKPEELSGKSIFEFLHPDDVQDFISMSENEVRNPGQSEPVEVRFLRKDGTWHTLEIVIKNLLDNPAVAGIVASFRDINERKQIENELRESEVRYRLVAENATDVIWIMDMNLQYTYVSPSVKYLRGYTPEEAMARSLEETATPASLEVAAKALGKVLNSEKTGLTTPFESQIIDMELYRKDGSTVLTEIRLGLLHDESGKPAGILGVTRDISERMQIENELRESEERFRNVLENSLDMVYRIDITTGRYDYVSPSSQQLLGYSPEEFKALGLENLVYLVHPDDSEKLSENVMSMIMKSKDDYKDSTVEYRFKHKELGYRWMSDNRSVIYDDAGMPTATVGTLRDITEQKTAEVELRIKESAIEHSINAIAMSGMDGTITYVNRACLEMWVGTDKEELVGKPYWVLLAVKDDVKNIVEAMIKNSSWEGELIAKRKDGKELDIHVLSSIVKDAHGNAIQTISSFMDITQRKRAEQALRESEERYRLITEKVTDVIWSMDTDLRHYTYVSPSITSQRGYSVEEAMAMPVEEMLPPSSLEKAVKLYSKALSQGKAEHDHPFRSLAVELEMNCRDGSTIWTETTSDFVYASDGSPVGIVGISRDISERRRTEQALQESETKFRRLVEEMNDGYCVLRGSKVVFINSRCAEMFGFSQEEVIGKTVQQFLPPEIVKELAQMRTKRESGDTVPWQYETTLVSKDGKTCTAELSTRIIDYEGVPTLSVVIRDISERKQAEEEIHKLNEELEQRVIERTTQLEAVNKELEAFAYSVSHDLRAPLRSIDGFSQILLEDCVDKLDEDGKGYLKRVRAASQRMGELIDDLLSLSRVTRGEMCHESVDLSSLAHTISEGLHQTQPERQVEFIITPGLVARGDARLLPAALENLLGNAWKFTSKRELALIEFGCLENNGQNVYYVGDNGVGFDMTYVDKLFGAFQRLHSPSEFEGTGIGLATVQRIIHRHGGNIWAESTTDKGATFYFTLQQ